MSRVAGAERLEGRMKPMATGDGNHYLWLAWERWHEGEIFWSWFYLFMAEYAEGEAEEWRKLPPVGRIALGS